MAFQAAAALVSSVAVTCSNSSFSSCSYMFGESCPSASANAVYNRTSNLTSGFAALDITTPLQASGFSRADVLTTNYAAGLAEGLLTAADMASFYSNVYEFGSGAPPTELLDFVDANDQWVRGQAAGRMESDDYWMAVASTYARFDGMLDGYNAQAANLSIPAMKPIDLLWVNLDGDLFDLMSAFGDISSPSAKLGGRKGRAKALWDGVSLYPNGLRCSALFKLTESNQELYFGHDTWDTYATAAPRSFKHLTLPVWSGEAALKRTVSFSSSPGFLVSIDDYYVVKDEKSSLVVIETSNNIYRHSAYSALTPQSVMCFARTAVANALAVDAPGWAKWFSGYPSGTYNNQWMVLDLNKFVKGQPLANDTFWVLEEVPGLIHAEDQSSWLQEKRYWGSYNVAFYPETRKAAGEVQNHSTCMRARLFASLQPSITSAEAMESVMAWNDYQNSSIAHSPSEAIMARGDLAAMPRTGGGIDSKVGSASSIAEGMCTRARAGPTNDDQPPFCWEGRFEHSSTPHMGHPVCFDFDWAPFKPNVS